MSTDDQGYKHALLEALLKAASLDARVAINAAAIEDNNRHAAFWPAGLVAASRGSPCAIPAPSFLGDGPPGFTVHATFGPGFPVPPPPPCSTPCGPPPFHSPQGMPAYVADPGLSELSGAVRGASHEPMAGLSPPRAPGSDADSSYKDAPGKCEDGETGERTGTFPEDEGNAIAEASSIDKGKDRGN